MKRGTRINIIKQPITLNKILLFLLLYGCTVPMLNKDKPIRDINAYKNLPEIS
jgi:hypothetical protein